MIKSDLIKAIVKKHGLTARQAMAILQTSLDEIVSALIKGEIVELRRFGVFKTKKQKPREIIHPQTGTPIERPAKFIVLFEASSTVKAAINKPPRIKAKKTSQQNKKDEPVAINKFTSKQKI